MFIVIQTHAVTWGGTKFRTQVLLKSQTRSYQSLSYKWYIQQVCVNILIHFHAISRVHMGWLLALKMDIKEYFIDVAMGYKIFWPLTSVGWILSPSWAQDQDQDKLYCLTWWEICSGPSPMLQPHTTNHTTVQYSTNIKSKYTNSIQY